VREQEEVLHRQSQGGEKYPTHNKKEGRLTALLTSCVRTLLLKGRREEEKN
jgi:hypothetical protein